MSDVVEVMNQCGFDIKVTDAATYEATLRQAMADPDTVSYTHLGIFLSS